jgi:hypothetical protein
VFLENLFGQNVHHQGAAHNPVPHWTADYSDIKNVFEALTPGHIPGIVYLLRDGEINGGMRSIGAGVFKMLGRPALLCIKAALDRPGIKGDTTLRGTRTNIETETDPPSQEK